MDRDDPTTWHEEGKTVWRMFRSSSRIGGRYKIQRGHWSHRQANLTGNWRWKFIVDPGCEFEAATYDLAHKKLKECAESWPAPMDE